MTDKIYKHLGICDDVISHVKKIEDALFDRFNQIDQIAEVNQLKVLKAMQDNRVSDTHFAATTGYGYNDLGRDTLENVYASVFNAEAALVRPQIISGTHALHIALASHLRPGDEILSPVGKPYDTLEEVIGIRETPGSLSEYGITYRQVDFLDNKNIDYPGIKEAIHDKTKLVAIQRSKGYDIRPTLSPESIGEIIGFVKSIKPDIICMVDNCYGEFVTVTEPTHYGADMVVGSLIKNPGGGLAPTGGYIVGSKACVDMASYRLTAPGLGKEVGATLGINQSLFQGLFLAPTVVAAAHKSALFAAAVFESLGYEVIPSSQTERYDIIQAISMKSPEAVIAFCQGIQMAAPVDSHVVPIPWAMPGYDAPVIMAAGSFIQGSSIELSADAPIKPPYTAYFQGGLTWYHGKYGVMCALQNMVNQKIIEIENHVKDRV
ncbi:methionine gamma-lyase family protein [Petrocella sp. FN5]|uniref:methionine gamma-lyase family protein n=1 Tax=Petrocella sp. FN5 TaxID=3032002 RepID=UPI0023DCA042|nr:methionine gamma-lyase family protein [Petrocella sp. FN5]MDF1617544.1 methionine gamma-lyase family protein [Petrocella sp. FN5]